jgi:hypothetical protein
MAKVEAFVESYSMCEQSAMHIRTTDMQRALEQKHRRGANLDAYFQFVESRPARERVFLLTDSPSTQTLFLNKYGPDKVLVYSVIANSTDRGTNHSASRPTDFRYTSIEHTLIDVLIAGHARDFKGSPFSSLSELVKMLGDIGRRERGWCGRGRPFR